jgi:hypothetical protein
MFKNVLKYVNILLVIFAGPALITKQKSNNSIATNRRI